jgi:hypothetical protein
VRFASRGGSLKSFSKSMNRGRVFQGSEYGVGFGIMESIFILLFIIIIN